MHPAVASHDGDSPKGQRRYHVQYASYPMSTHSFLERERSPDENVGQDEAKETMNPRTSNFVSRIRWYTCKMYVHASKYGSVQNSRGDGGGSKWIESSKRSYTPQNTAVSRILGRKTRQQVDRILAPTKFSCCIRPCFPCPQHVSVPYAWRASLGH